MAVFFCQQARQSNRFLFSAPQNIINSQTFHNCHKKNANGTHSKLWKFSNSTLANYQFLTFCKWLHDTQLTLSACVGNIKNLKLDNDNDGCDYVRWLKTVRRNNARHEMRISPPIWARPVATHHHHRARFTNFSVLYCNFFTMMEILLPAHKLSLVEIPRNFLLNENSNFLNHKNARMTRWNFHSNVKK